MNYFSLQNILMIGGVMLFVAIQAGVMIATTDDDSSAKGNGQEGSQPASRKVKFKSILSAFGSIITILMLAFLAFASLFAGINAVQMGEILDFLRSTLLFLNFSFVTIFFIFHKRNWVRELMSGRSFVSRAIYVIMALGFIGPMVLHVLSALAK